MAAVVAGDDGNGCENHDERCTSLLSVEEAASQLDPCDCVCVPIVQSVCVVSATIG